MPSAIGKVVTPAVKAQSPAYAMQFHRPMQKPQDMSGDWQTQRRINLRLFTKPSLTFGSSRLPQRIRFVPKRTVYREATV